MGDSAGANFMAFIGLAEAKRIPRRPAPHHVHWGKSCNATIPRPSSQATSIAAANA